MDNKDYEPTEREIKNYQKNKQIKRTMPELEEHQLYDFIKLVAENAPLVTYEVQLGLSARDVFILKEKLGIDGMEQAKNALKKMEKENG